VTRQPRAAALVGAVLALSGCVTPATGNDSYRGKARSSVQAAISETQTTRIALETLQRGRIFTTSADETVTASESAVGSISSAFGSVQPPTESDQLHDQISKLLTDVEDALVAARIAVRRGDTGGIRRALAEVHDVINALESAEKQLS
jgi:hypothetical protein